jgi:hypothetical protein
VHPVGAEEDISLNLPPVRKPRAHRLAAVLKAGAAGTQVDDRGVELGSQQLLQLGSVDENEPAPPPPGHRSLWDVHQPGAIGSLDTLPANCHRQLRHLAGQPDRLKGGHGVRPQPHPYPHLFQRRGLLIDLGG